MNYRGTIAYRSGIGSHIPEGFTASFISAWDFLNREYNSSFDRYGSDGSTQERSIFYFMRGLSCMLHDSANQIAGGFLGDWVLFLDTDHVFKSDAFYNMVTTFEENSLDILVGFAQKRQPPYTPLIYKTDFNPLRTFEPILPGPIEKNMLLPIDAAGLGCLMVRRRVFDKIKEVLDEKPFDFRYKFVPHIIPGQSPEGVYDAMEYFNKAAGYDYQLPKDRHWQEFYWEDISFFWRAALLGFKAYCAPWIKFHHIETRLVTDDLIQTPKES